MSPELVIERTSQGNPKSDRPEGIIANTPDTDGEYSLNAGGTVEVEMNPPENKDEKTRVIALTSNLFKGHVRGTGKRGSARRTIHLRKGEGATMLSSHEILRVKLKTGSE